MTTNDLERLTEYLNTNATKYAHETHEYVDDRTQNIKVLCVGDFDQLYKLMAEFVANEKEHTCGPDYGAMYRIEHMENQQLKKEIKEYEAFKQQHLIDDALYVGAVEMLELLTGRKIGFHQRGEIT
jgi:hypothetical protein